MNDSILVSVFKNIFVECFKILGDQPFSLLYNAEISYEPSKEEVEKRFGCEMN